MTNQNLGIRIGAAGHFASRMVAAAVNSGQVSYNDAAAEFANLTVDCFAALNTIEDSYAPTNVQPIATATSYSAPRAAEPMRTLDAAFPGSTMVDTKTVTVTHAAMPEIANASNLSQDGINNGPLPAWLGPICAKYGVGKVFDNRHQLADGPTRPWFRQAGVPSGQTAKGFWPDSK